MKSIKKLLVLVMLTSTLFGLAAFESGSDVVVLMDASGTILPYFDEINNRVLVDITKKFVRQGDVFHLISFNSRVNLEIVQPVQTEADISRIVSRFMLLYPLGQNSDFLSGLQYTWQYVSSLDQQRNKIVIIISDGIFNPPESSPYFAFTSEQIHSELSDISRRIQGAGWNVYYIKLPFPENTEIRTLDGKTVSKPAGTATKQGSDKTVKQYNDISGEFSSALGIKPTTLPESNVPVDFVNSVFSMPEITFPRDLGRKGRFFILPLKVKNNSTKPVNMELTGIFMNDTDVLVKNSFLNLSPGSAGNLKAEIHLPDTVTRGPQDIPMRLVFSGNLRVIPQTGSVHIVLSNFSFDLLFRTGGSIVFALFLILIAAFLVLSLFLFIARRTSKPVSDAVRLTERKENRPKEAPGIGRNTVSPQNLQTAKTTSSARGAEVLQKADTSGMAIPDEKSRSKTQKIAIATDFPKSVPAVLSVQETSSEPAVSMMSVNSLAAEQLAEKSERLSVLSAAARKPDIRTTIKKSADPNEHIAIRNNRNILLELYVDNQNPNIGKRNIHLMKAGSRLSLGGGTSSFLVFLVKFPSRIAEIRYDGEECSLAILKPQYFPFESSNLINNCINRKITIVSDRTYTVVFEMHTYEDPVKKLNRLLTSINY
jgi:hypothetical protein